MPSKLKPALLILGLAGGAVAAIRKRAGGGGGGDGGGPEQTPRYAAPAEAGAQPPAEAGGAPSDDPQATVARSVPADPTDLATPPPGLPDDVVVPDTSTDDPVVQEAEAAAAADARSIGGTPGEGGTQP
jgi:hypothetical protein